MTVPHPLSVCLSMLLPTHRLRPQRPQHPQQGRGATVARECVAANLGDLLPWPLWLGPVRRSVGARRAASMSTRTMPLHARSS